MRNNDGHANPDGVPHGGVDARGRDRPVEVQASDGKSGSTFERLRIDGERYFLKSLSHDEDWIMRVTGDVDHRPLLSWRAGLYHQTPDCIDHTIVAMAVEGSGTSARLSMLMHDIGEHLIPEGDEVVALDVHESFIDHMAAMHAHFWGWTDTVGLTPLAHRFRFFAPDNIAAELRRPDVSPVITVADQGWRLLRDRAPTLAAIAATDSRGSANVGERVGGDAARRSSPAIGRWATSGTTPTAAPSCSTGRIRARRRERGISVGTSHSTAPACRRSKEATIAGYRAALERRGIDTADWFDRQIALSLLGIAACFGWEKAHGDDDELQWWQDRAEHAHAAQLTRMSDDTDDDRRRLFANRGRVASRPGRDLRPPRDGARRLCARVISAAASCSTSAPVRAPRAEPSPGAGGVAVAVDAAYGMLAADRARRPAAVVGDACALPLRNRAVDAVVAAFSLNHLDDPVAGLREAARVTLPGGALLASAYAEDDTHPGKGRCRNGRREHGLGTAAVVSANAGDGRAQAGDRRAGAGRVVRRRLARRGPRCFASRSPNSGPSSCWRGASAWRNWRRSWQRSPPMARATMLRRARAAARRTRAVGPFDHRRRCDRVIRREQGRHVTSEPLLILR